MRLNKALEEKKMDIRLRDKLLGEGKLTISEVDSFLRTLADDEDSAVFSAPGSTEKKPVDEESSAEESSPLIN
ncbi:MAG: hypothetical protein HN353_05415 [Bdellovibrionales bacterium]|jgi:hypothetical protein|nr:hypothetical protein [Bdellovibrionales bacterium]MBT3525119.1 hypothetical protein [Bdellovibrionales bacterium]MBT7765809.1 hypothetical protein [Bdellovibrionales bacterium]